MEYRFAGTLDVIADLPPTAVRRAHGPQDKQNETNVRLHVMSI